MQQTLVLAIKERKRQLFVLTGDEASAIEDLHGLIGEHFTAQRIIWMGAWAAPTSRQVAFEGISAELGTENDHVVINAYSGFNVDAFAAIAGTIKAGGAMFLIIPPMQEWPTFLDPFLHRLRVMTTHSSDTTASLYLKRMAEEISSHTRLLDTRTHYYVRCFPISDQTSDDKTTDDESRDEHAEQRETIHAIKQLHQQQSYRVLILTADRGRGKSTALGIAAAELINLGKSRLGKSRPGKNKPGKSRQGKCKIATVAPTRRSIAIMMLHFNSALNHADDKVHLNTFAPDQVDQIDHDTQLILVDEAASIPLPILIKIADSKIPTVFTTTINGYEGAGRGFALRFTQRLKKDAVPFSWRTLDQPFRWSRGDPLEEFCNQAFMLNAELPQAPTVVHLEKLQVTEITQTQLANDHLLLSSVYGLLAQAHYRTTPIDLVHILDGSNIKIIIAKLCGRMVAAALVAMEGPILDAGLRQGVLDRKRRPQGHILPQLMAQYGMSAAALDLSIARIVRIAVHPDVQGLGLGSRFLRKLTVNFIHKSGKLDGPAIDAMGAIFGGAPETVNFWNKNGYSVWHISKRAQPSNGYRSVSVLKAMTPAATELLHRLKILHHDQINFQKCFEPIDTNSCYKHNQSELQRLATHQSSDSDSGTCMAAAQHDSFVIDHYQQSCRTFYDSQAAITRACRALLQSEKFISRNQGNVDSEEFKIAQCLALQPGISLSDLAATIGLTGKKDAEARIRAMLRRHPNQ